jgi:hypothetical protein
MATKVKKQSVESKLREELKRAENSEFYYKGRLETAENRLQKFEAENKERQYKEMRNSDEIITHNRQLLEIIRWQMNPETTKFPFSFEKSQRDERIDRGPRSLGY